MRCSSTRRRTAGTQSPTWRSLALFGLPRLETVLAAYDAESRLADGWQERVELHQLAPLLLHVFLFGGSYTDHALRAAPATRLTSEDRRARGLRKHQGSTSGRPTRRGDARCHDHVPDPRDRPSRPSAPGAPTRRPAAARLFLGEREDARWLRPALWALLVVTAVVYLWDLGISGYANSFYAAAVQAGTKSWEAFFFGSLDSSNFITVDKPPASLWVMVLSARVFGFSSFSLLLPQALMAVGSVALVWGTVRRTLARLGRRPRTSAHCSPASSSPRPRPPR